MKTFYKFAIALMIPWMVLSCVYESPVDSKPGVKVDPALIGTWRVEDGRDRIQIRQFNEYEYILIDPDKPENLTRGYISEIGTLRLLNLLEINPSGPADKYTILSYRMDNGKIKARALNPDVIPPTLKSSREMRKAIEDHLKDPKLFKDEEPVYVRE